MVKSPPNIMEFAEYRKYLLERYRFMKLNDRKFSHRFINGKVGVKSSGWFGDLVSGRQRLMPSHVRNVAAVFKLSPEEQKCLGVLVELESAETPEDSASAYEKWAQIKGIGRETIAKDRFKYYEKWYISVFRELLSIRPGLRDPAFLAAALDPGVSPKQAQEALGILERLGLLGEDAAAMKSAPVLVKDPAARTRHWKKMMSSMIKLGRRALDKYDRDQRDFSGLTLTFSPEGLKKAGEEITALRKRLLYLSEKDGRSDRVYNCLFQVYPVSHSLEAPHG